MDIFISRNPSTDLGTPGDLSVSECGYSCDTLELPWRNNETGKSCVLPDTYQCQPWYSPHLGRMVLRLEDKNGRKDCLVHNGNFAGDVDRGFETQIHGCTEVGRGYGDIKRHDGTPQFGILNSRVTLDALLAAIGPGPHTVTYCWKPGAEPGDHQPVA